MLGDATPDEARAFLAGTTFLWHQQFELAPGVTTPGTSKVAFLLEAAGVPADLTGRSVLDVGTANGGCAFELERRGASRVVAVDIYPPDHFGFTAIAQFVGSRTEFVQGSVYELPDLLRERFDVVLFFGVLYHLRHPLLALDRLRELTARDVFVETAVCDHEMPDADGQAYVRFYRGDELAGDASNWFAPSVTALNDWMLSGGFDIARSYGWPPAAPQRAVVAGVRSPDPPEYQRVSYESPIVSLRTRQMV